MMWNWCTSKPCVACAEKDRRIADHAEQLLLLKSQLSHSREREEKAVDALLHKEGVASVTPQPRLSMKDSENAMKDIMGLFLDVDDKGDGQILEADNLGVQGSPLT